MTIVLNGTTGITTPTTNSTGEFVTSVTGFKNRIINGAMVIDQRNAGASVTPTTDNTYIVDRFKARLTQSSKYSIQQSTTAPTGFINSLLATSLSAYSVTSSDYFGINQNIEGLNVADLGWGTASAATVTLSFWVRSSLTGTFGGALFNSSFNRSYPFTYTINAANTFEQKTVTIAGDTTGTWLTTNGVGISVFISLGAGSTYSGTAGAWAAAGYVSATGATSVVGTNGATFYITGVQLEKGSTATSFDYRPYGTELALCQRYYEVIGFISGMPYGTTGVFGGASFKATKRAAPTIALLTSTPSFYAANVGTVNGSGSTAAASNATVDGVYMAINGFTGLVVTNPVASITASLISASIEL